MPELDLDRLERLARAQLGLEIGTGITVLPGELLELVTRARRAWTEVPPCPREGCDLGQSPGGCADPACPQRAPRAEES